MIVLAVVNLKGGTGKTTTAAFVAHALHEQGRRVLVVDADPQGSAQRWSEYAGSWPVSVVGMATKTLHRQLAGVVGDRFDVVVIDTPPLDEQRGIVMSALQVATDVLVPVAPTPIECERMAAVREALEAASDLRPSGQPPRMAVLLTRTVAGAVSTGVWRELLTEAGDRVLSVHVGRLERFAQAYGDPIIKASATAYGDAVTELLNGVRA